MIIISTNNINRLINEITETQINSKTLQIEIYLDLDLNINFLWQSKVYRGKYHIKGKKIGNKVIKESKNCSVPQIPKLKEKVENVILEEVNNKERVLELQKYIANSYEKQGFESKIK